MDLNPTILVLLVVTGKVAWGNKPRYGHLLPADVGDDKFQNEKIYLLDDSFFGLRTSLFYCPTACHSLIQPVRAGEPGCVDLGLDSGMPGTHGSGLNWDEAGFIPM